MKFVKPLTPAEQVTLQEALKYGPSARVRQRAHAIYLSSKGFKILQLVEIFEVDRDTLSGWLDQWEGQGLVGLYDAPRAGDRCCTRRPSSSAWWNVRHWEPALPFE